MNPITAYNLVEMAWPWRLRGPSNQQSATSGLLYIPGGYRQRQTGGTPTETTTPTPGLELGYFSLHNRSGAAGVVGIGVRIPNTLWQAGQWTDASTTFTDDTADAQSTATGDFPLETTTNNDGFVIASSVPFNAISIDVATASGAGSATRAIRYSNRAGTGWQSPAANNFIHTGAAQTGAATGYIVTATTAANEALIVFDAFEDWGTTTTAAVGTGVPLGMYAINVRATTASTTAGAADSLSIYRMYWLTEGLADNGTFELTLGAMGAYMEPAGDALVPLFETANDLNRALVLVRPRG